MRSLHYPETWKYTRVVHDCRQVLPIPKLLFAQPVHHRYHHCHPASRLCGVMFLSPEAPFEDLAAHELPGRAVRSIDVNECSGKML